MDPSIVFIKGLFLFVWFDYVPVNIFSFMSGRIFLGWTSTKLELMSLAHGHNAVTPLRLEPVAPLSRVKHATTESLLSQVNRFSAASDSTYWAIQADSL